ncbi:MAG: CAP domain-containing protein [Cyanobacteria bacterium P01_F01_bin.86]
MMSSTRCHKRCMSLARSLLLTSTIALSLASSPVPFAVAPSLAQTQMNHPFDGHIVVYVLSGDRWREATIVGYSSRYDTATQQQPVWTYTIEYVDDQGGRETEVAPSRLQTVAEAQALGLTETVYNLTTQAGIDQMLAAHNQVRREVGVSDLVWSEPLAELAQAWADQLISESGLRHRPAAERDQGRIGENLSGIYWSAPGGALRSPHRAVQGWIEEKADYDYATNTCAEGKVCGHYTQVVWADTTEVGCAVARNENVTRDVWVCNYAPMGNIIGQRPY